MDNLIIVAAAIVVVIVLILITGYVKAPTDTAVIISGLKKEPKYVIGRSSIKIPFLQRTDKLTLKMISVDVKTEESVPTNDYIKQRSLQSFRLPRQQGHSMRQKQKVSEQKVLQRQRLWKRKLMLWLNTARRQ